MPAEAQAAAYGVRLTGLPATPWLAVRGADDWPEVTIERGGEAPFTIDTERRRVTVAAAIALDDVIHPVLAHTGLDFALAHGMDALHGGAVVVDGAAWAVVAAGERGKSTLLAAAAAAGLPVLCDDVLIVDGDHVLTGPRCVDLRRPPPGDAPVVRRGSRWRVTLEPIAARWPLAGIVHLEWRDRLAVTRLAAPEALRRLAARQREDRYPRDPAVAFALASVPAFELGRPRDLDGIGATLEALVGVLTEA